MATGSQQLQFAIRAVNEASKALKDVGADLDDLGAKAEKGSGPLSKASGALGDMSKIAGGFVIGTALTKAPGLYQDLSRQASELELQNKKVNTVFGDQSRAMRDWASQSANSLGLTKNEALGLSAGLADLLIPMGMTREQAAQMSQETIGLAGALSEWSGGQRSAAEVSDILTKAYLGERDGLKALGISISEADVQAQLAKKGQEDLTAAALEQAKAIATQELIFAKSTDAQAAYAAGADSAARKQAEAAAKVREWKEDIATGLQPAFLAITDIIATKVIPGIEQFANVAGPKIKEFSENVQKYWKENIEPAIDNMIAAWEKISPVVLPILELVARETERAVKAIALSLGIIVDLISGDWSGAWEKAKEIARLAWESIEDRVRTAKEVLTNLAPLLKEAGIAILTGLKDGITDVYNNHIEPFFKNLPGNLLTAIGDVRKLLFSKGWELIKGLVDGMLSVDIPNPIDMIPGAGKVTGAIGKINPFAGGTDFAPGGMALVGERGPELIELPRGSRVYTARETAGMKNAGGTTIIHQHFNVQGSVWSVDELAYELQRRGFVTG